MARTAQQKIYADFRQGFVTVANPLAYPEGSLKDITNFNINTNGTLSKRPGLRKDSEDNLIDAPVTNFQFTEQVKTFLWKDAGRVANRDFLVVFKNKTIYLFNADDDGIDMSSFYRQKSVITDAPTMQLAYSDNIQDAQVVEGSGFLFFVHPKCRPVKISLTENDSIVLEELDIKIRDLKIWRGKTDEETGLGENLQTCPAMHEYNLRNGGWPKKTVVSETSLPSEGIFENVDPVSYTRTADKVDRYPSISTPFYVGRAGGAEDLVGANAYSPWNLTVDYFGNTTVPVGRNIVSAERWARFGNGYTPISVDGVDVYDYSKVYEWTSYPSCVAFYAGRVWYSGAKGYQETASTPGYKKDNISANSTIYFSQQISDEPSKAALCYQENDPTVEDVNQLLPTDGGTVSIEALGNPYSMVVFGSYLIIFSDNGIWAISGREQSSFTADSYSVNKISNIRAVSSETIVEAKNTIYFLAEDAIYSLRIDDVSGLPAVQDISSSKIKDYYLAIPFNNKRRAKLFYDEGSRIFYILFEDAEEEGAYFSLDFPEYRNILILDEDLGAYYKYKLSSFDNIGYYKRIVGAVYYPRNLYQTVQNPITLYGNPVTLDGEPVTLDDRYFFGDASTLLFIFYGFEGGGQRTQNTLFTASFTDNQNFEDLGASYEGSVEFGFDTAGDIMRDSVKAPVIISHMERTEDGFEVNPDDPDEQELVLTNQSSCFLSYGWDWATTYSRPQQLYRFKRNYIPSGTTDTFDYGVDVITTRNRIRGKGHSLGISLASEADKDCKLLGLGIMYTVADRI